MAQTLSTCQKRKNLAENVVEILIDQDCPALESKLVWCVNNALNSIIENNFAQTMLEGQDKVQSG